MNAPPRFADLVQGRDNNLNLLRFLAATGVVYAHSFGVLDATRSEPFFRLMGRGLGDFGVDIFFVVSGLLVTKSLLGKSSIGTFAWARVMRVFPALWISVLTWVLVAGLWLSPLSAMEFWKQPQTLSFILKNLTMLPGSGAQTYLPNAFSASESAFNVPLWTLPHELQMYALLAILGALGLVRSGWCSIALAAFAIVNLFLEHLGLPSALPGERARFIFFFFAGASLYAFRARIIVRASIFWALCAAVAAVCAISNQLAVRQLALALATPYLVLWLAYGPAGFARRFNELGDYSYGIYILAFPLQLLIAQFSAAREPLVHFALSMCAVLPLAVASWHFVESRLLRMRAPAILDRLIPLNAREIASPSLGKVRP